MTIHHGEPLAVPPGGLPRSVVELVHRSVERHRGRTALRWKTEGDRPFPMPLQVRVGPPGGEVVEVAMTGGRGHVALSGGEVFTVDPASKVLRAMPHVERYRADREARAKETD